ncbi:radical SAM family heme chaperone HemW [Enterovibrio paralichthyis]|uniref:radical SAM family heme chaperone HemW n=1 Tax=Enterovibrio paralichthyis TaxID=2853805 RepID=UPI001C48CF4C|nr:radical SAM family heme chaperone HemW [Enterovibrio paralichthyis]MBV7297836.1 radical SAM family heme chaperone HemW [Enterovibrio paralichthyis]
MATNIPLSLYVHIPWCVQKCPYCDFNSHTLKGDVPEHDYIDALLDDLKQDLHRFEGVSGRALHSIFIGGGTPSLMSPQEISRLLQGIQAQIPFAENIEVTMEANPGTVEADKFVAYRKAGVNRISIGVQSFDNQKLQRLGRIHGAAEAKRAAALAHEAGLASFNLDLMHGLPDQSLDGALDDLRQAIELNPPHLSWYQLTIEPNTQYYSKPPTLPDDDDLWDIFEQGHQLLTEAGYVQYETSGYSKPGYQCRHNLNYWRFGDYLGIGCGAHGKITLDNSTVQRTVKVKHPRGYLDPEKEYLSELHIVESDELPFEFFMNRFRLVEPCPKADFPARTGLPLETVDAPLQNALSAGLLSETETHWQVTEKGRLFLNDLLAGFINE